MSKPLPRGVEPLAPVVIDLSPRKVRAKLTSILERLETVQQDMPNDEHPLYAQGAEDLDGAIESLRALIDRL